jgi:hypothetical protein
VFQFKKRFHLFKCVIIFHFQDLSFGDFTKDELELYLEKSYHPPAFDSHKNNESAANQARGEHAQQATRPNPNSIKQTSATSSTPQPPNSLSNDLDIEFLNGVKV